MAASMVELRRTGHDGILRETLKELAQHEAYWNVMVFCRDGTLALNRLTIGLIFPQLQDEISVICPVTVLHSITITVEPCFQDHTTSDISTLIDDTLNPPSWPASMCRVEWGPGEPVVAVVAVESRAEEQEPERDPLDQLCFDLAPFNQPRVTEDAEEIQFIATTNAARARHVETIDLTEALGSCSPIRTKVKTELKDPLADILAESSDDDEDYFNGEENMMDSLHHGTELHYTDNEMMVQHILDSIIDNLEEYKQHYKEKAYQSAQVLFYSEASEYIEEKPDIGACANNDEHQRLSIWSRDLDTGQKCDLDSRVDVQNLRLDFEAWSQINRALREREGGGSEVKTLKNKRIYLERKKKLDVMDEDTEETTSCLECDKVFYGRLGCHRLKRHMLMIHNKVESSAIPNQIRLVNRTVEITPLGMQGRETLITNQRQKTSTNTAKKSTTKPPKWCGSCRSCLVEDCRRCVYCADMKKYGGKGVKKQRCMERPPCLEYLKRMGRKASALQVEKGLAGSRSPGTGSPSRNSTPSSRPSRTSSPAVRPPKVASPASPRPVGRPRKAPKEPSVERVVLSSSISEARKRLRDVENDMDPGRLAKKRPASSSPLRLRAKDSDTDLKERLRQRAEGEWVKNKISRKLSSKYKHEAERRRTVSVRKVTAPPKHWPTKEELLFGFPLCDK